MRTGARSHLSPDLSPSISRLLRVSMPGSAPAMCEDRSANGHVPNPTSEVSEVLGSGQVGQEGQVLHEKVLLG